MQSGAAYRATLLVAPQLTPVSAGLKLWTIQSTNPFGGNSESNRPESASTPRTQQFRRTARLLDYSINAALANSLLSIIPDSCISRYWRLSNHRPKVIFGLTPLRDGRRSPANLGFFHRRRWPARACPRDAPEPSAVATGGVAGRVMSADRPLLDSLHPAFRCRPRSGSEDTNSARRR